MRGHGSGVSGQRSEVGGFHGAERWVYDPEIIVQSLEVTVGGFRVLGISVGGAWCIHIVRLST